MADEILERAKEAIRKDRELKKKCADLERDICRIELQLERAERDYKSFRRKHFTGGKWKIDKVVSELLEKANSEIDKEVESDA